MMKTYQKAAALLLALALIFALPVSVRRQRKQPRPVCR